MIHYNALSYRADLSANIQERWNQLDGEYWDINKVHSINKGNFA